MLRKLQRAAARLARDVPAPVETAPAPAPDDDEDEGEYEPYDDEGEYEPEPERDARPRGLYVVGGERQQRQADPEPEQSQPRQSAMPGFELPSGLRRLIEDIKPLTKLEAAALRESTIRSFMQFWKYADDGISATNAQRAEAHIWRQVDREETETLVDFMIERGKQSAAAAQIVRGISNVWNYYAVGLILGPRFYRTFRFYAAHGGFAL